jgi:hypothetical protein
VHPYSVMIDNPRPEISLLLIFVMGASAVLSPASLTDLEAPLVLVFVFGIMSCIWACLVSGLGLVATYQDYMQMARGEPRPQSILREFLAEQNFVPSDRSRVAYDWRCTGRPFRRPQIFSGAAKWNWEMSAQGDILSKDRVLRRISAAYLEEPWPGSNN